MDARIRGKFYQVENVGNGDATFYEAMHLLWDHPERTAYVEIYGGIRVRLERFSGEPEIAGEGFIEGEFVRQQTENIPPIANQNAELEGQENPLGHRCAFRYHAGTNTLLLESRPYGVTAIRMDGLVKVRLAPHRGFFLSPVLTEAAIERLRNGTPRKVSFRVANPANMEAVEGDERSIEENLTRMANNFGGLTVETSVGFPRGALDRSLNPNRIIQAIKWAAGNRDHVEKFEVKISEEEDPINIFAEQMKASARMDLENLDVDANYEVRRQYFRRTFDANLPDILRLYTN